MQSHVGLFLNDGTGRFVYTPVSMGDSRNDATVEAVCCIPGGRHPR